MTEPKRNQRQIAEKIAKYKRLRAKGLNPHQAAAKCKVTRWTVQRWKREGLMD